VIRLRGNLAGQNFVKEIPVELPESQPEHDSLATLWARTRIDDLMSQDYAGIQSGNAKPDVREAITHLGLEYRLMTQFTSFVAVEETIVTDGGQPRRIDVPVEMPEGVSREGVFGETADRWQMRSSGSSAKRKSLSRMGPEEALPRSGGGYAPKPMPAPATTRASAANETSNGSSSIKGQLPAKLHPAIAAVIERLKNKGAKPAAEELKFTRDGKAEIQVWLSDKSAQTIEQLKKLGFEVVLDPQSSKLIIGRLPIEKLAALAELPAVKYIAPQTK
jgi:Ca-activated chloride channel family protein